MARTLRCTDYHVAWIASVGDVESIPCQLMLDERHNVPKYDRKHDTNIYECGNMTGHDIVIASCPPGMAGNVNVGAVAKDLFRAFPQIEFTLLVGIGGGIPDAISPHKATDDIHLGDVVVGWPADGGPSCVYYDHERLKAAGEFQVMGTINRPSTILLNALQKLYNNDKLKLNHFEKYRHRLLMCDEDLYKHPGLEKDVLYDASYDHVGEFGNDCIKCESTKRISRTPRTEKDVGRLVFHRGRIASGNAVIQDGQHRDIIRDRASGARCIEMEAAGVDVTRPCLVIRGISDYADSHKSDNWRHFAAGNAAVFARELLSKIPSLSADIDTTVVTKSIPMSFDFNRNPDFVGREDVLGKLLHQVSPSRQPSSCQRTVVHGLGGMGKTQVAIELMYRLQEEDPACSVFWAPAHNIDALNRAFEKINSAVGTLHSDGVTNFFSTSVKESLSQAKVGTWVLVIDNLDDVGVLSQGLLGRLPFSRSGSILFTTRNGYIADKLDVRPSSRIMISALNHGAAVDLLHNGLRRNQIGSPTDTQCLLDHLSYIPLAVRQASAYMNRFPIVSVSTYLRQCERSDESMVAVLSKHFHDQGQYPGSRNPVALSLLCSFTSLAEQEPLALAYLAHISVHSEKNISMDQLPTFETEGHLAREEAISTLAVLGLIEMQDDSSRFNAHRLVCLAMRNSLESKGRLRHILHGCVRQHISAFKSTRNLVRKVLRSRQSIEAAFHILPHLSALSSYGWMYAFARKEEKNVWLFESLVSSSHSAAAESRQIGTRFWTT